MKPAAADTAKSANTANTAKSAAPSAAPAPSTPAAPPAASPAAVAPLPVSALPADTAKPAAQAAPVTADTALKAADGMPAAADTAPAAETSPSLTTGASAPADTAAQSAQGGSDTAKTVARKKRKRVVRETTVNTIDELKGRYRSPKKALFMSLIVPGLGQAYVGQHWFNYTRGAAYLLTDVGLAMGWRHYVVTKQDRQIARYRTFADSNWRQYRYENKIDSNDASNFFDLRNPHRESYCQSVQSQQGTTGNRLFQGCLSPDDPARDPEYQSFKNENNDEGLPTDSISRIRAGFPNTHNFYELIGKEVEFITGWADAGDVIVGDSTFTLLVGGKSVPATTALQKEYIGMRAQANDYARMQAWFLGGMVLNHLVSALDAAFTAHLHNKSLYQTDIGFLDRFRLDSWVAWDEGAPVPTLSASYTF